MPSMVVGRLAPTDVVKFELLKVQVELLSLERFSLECRKTKTKVICLANHNRRKQRNKPIRICYKYM